MKYNQPYGISDPNAAYINGNPSTGTAGSIPPAASIENPQREIVNLIADAGGTPSDADLHQLGRGVQSGRLTYGVDFGTVNVYSMIVTPPLLAYAAGQRWAVKIANDNKGPSTLNISGLGGRPIIFPGGAPLKGGELVVGGIVTLIDDGANLQLQNYGLTPIGQRLTAPMDLYVDAAIGSDTLYDGSAPTVSGGTHGPFATIQRAISAAFDYNQNGFTITIHVANGTYPPFICTQNNGSGLISIIGNLTTPANVLIHATSGEAILVDGTAAFRLSGMKVQTDAQGATPHLGVGLRVYRTAATFISNMEFGYCYYAHMSSEDSADITFDGSVSGHPAAFIVVSGDTQHHMDCRESSRIYLGGAKLYTTGSRSIGLWANVGAVAVINSSYGSVSLGGAVAGQKFASVLNGVIYTGGGVNYFPGNVAGYQATGGQVS